MSPVEWDRSLSLPPVASSRPGLLEGGLLRRWVATAQEMKQPALDHHYLVLHLGGAKRVTRSGEGSAREVDVLSGQLTVVPAGSSYRWRTAGPIDFVHLYIDPKRMDRVVAEVFDRDPRCIELQDPIGLPAPVIGSLLVAMLEEATDVLSPPKLYLEGLYDAVLLRLVRRATNASEAPIGARQAIAPYRLRRVCDFVAGHLAEDIDIQSLADVAGLSRFHFSRAFQQTTGYSPYGYVLQQRVAHAKLGLSDPKRSIAEVAQASGFNSSSQFSATFKKLVGVGPREWRKML